MNIRHDTGLIPCLSDQEVARVMDEAGRYGQTRAGRIKWKTLMALLINYGPRISEATSLRWDMVNFERKTITFPTSKQFRRLPDGTREPIKRTRTLPLFPQIATLLRAHQRRVNGDPRVFPSWATRKTGRNMAWQVFQELLKRAGLPPMRLHGLRHTAATRLAEIDPILAQNVLGHRDLSTTTVYVHARRMKKQFEKMEPILGTRKAPWPPDPQNAPEREEPSSGDPGQAPKAVPWGMPWVPPPVDLRPPPEAPMPEPAKPDDETQRRLDRLEGSMVFLLRGLGKQAQGRVRYVAPPRPVLALPVAVTEDAAEASPPAPTESVPEAASDLGPPPEADTEFFDLEGLAAFSSYTVLSLRKFLHHPTHPLPHFRVGVPGHRGGKLLVRRSEFEAWLERWRQFQEDPNRILPAGPEEQQKPRYLLRERLAAYDLGRVCELQKILGGSRQYSEQILSGRNGFGVRVAKKIAEAVGVSFTQVLEWQEESIKAVEAGTPLLPDEPLPKAKARSPLCEKLAHYGLDSEIKLAQAMKVHRQRAAQLLRGDRFGKCTARKIATIIGGSAEEVLTWQDAPQAWA